MANGDFVDAIQSEISRVTEDLNHVDENLKKLTGRDFSDQRSQIRNKELGPGDDTLSRKDPVGFRSGQARFRGSLDNDEDEDGWSRRKPLREVVTSRGDRSRLSSTRRDDRFETKRRSSGGVFQRLGDPVSRHGERVVEEVPSDDQGREDAAPSQIKSTISSSIAAVRPASEIQDGKSRTEAVAEMTKDRVSMGRNRRMFGALLGTLKSFKNEEARGKVKKDQRAIVEWKVEQRTQAEREKMAKEREELLQKRRERESRIRKLQDKMEDFKKHKEYENYQRELCKFIRTRTKPHVFWLPKKIDSIASKLISQTARAIEDEIDVRRNELKNELDEIIAEKRAMEKSPVSREDSVEEGELRSKDARDNRDNRSTSKNLEEDEDGSDHLDYDADDLLFEDALMLSGKNEETQVSKSQRVVVQVNRSANESISERKVELVSMRANGNALGKEKKAEKAREVLQQRKGRIVVARRNGAVESANNNNVVAAKSEKVRMTIKQEKKLMKKEKKEKKRKLKESKKREKKLKKRLKKKLRKEKSSSESEEAEEGSDKEEEDDDDDNNNGEKEDERENDGEDVDEDSDANNTSQEPKESESSFALSKDPAPAMTEVVVQHVPISDSRDSIDTENIQVQTLVIDTANIKKDKESAEYCNGAAPALFRNIVIKREKNATPPPSQEKEMNEIIKVEGRSKQRKEASKNLTTAKNQRNKEKKDDSSSDDDDNVKEDEDESKSDDTSSSNESDSSAPENEKSKNDRKQPVKSPKKKQRRRRSRDSSAASSSGNSDSDSQSEDEKDRKNRNSDRRSSPSSSSSASGSSSESSPDSSSASSDDEESPKKKKSAAVSSSQKGRRSRSPRRAPVSKNQRSSRSSPPPASSVSASAKKRSRSPPASKKKSRSPVSKKKRASSPAAVSKHKKSSSSPMSKKKSSRSSPVSRKRSRSPQSKRRVETKRKVSRSRSRSRGKKEKDLKSRRR